MGDGKAVVQRQLEDGYEIIEVQTPCLLTAVKELNQPRYMSIGGIVDAYKKEITVWDHNAVELIRRTAALTHPRPRCSVPLHRRRRAKARC